MELLSRLHNMAVTAVEHLAIATLVSGAVLLLNPKARESRKVFLAAILLGTSVGFAASQTPIISEFDFVLSVLASLTGPATVAAWQHKTLVEVIRILRREAEDAKTERTK